MALKRNIRSKKHLKHKSKRKEHTKHKKNTRKRVNKKTKKRSKKGGDGDDVKKNIWINNVKKLTNVLGKKPTKKTMNIPGLSTDNIVRFDKLDDKNIQKTYKLIPTKTKDNSEDDNETYWVDDNNFIIRTNKKDPPLWEYTNKQLSEPVDQGVISTMRGKKYMTLKDRTYFWNTKFMKNNEYIGKTFLYNGHKYTLEKVVPSGSDLISNDGTVSFFKQKPPKNLARVTKGPMPVWRDDNGFKIFIGWNSEEIQEVRNTPKLRENLVLFLEHDDVEQEPVDNILASMSNDESTRTNYKTPPPQQEPKRYRIEALNKLGNDGIDKINKRMETRKQPLRNITTK